jgi:alkanesulfonate monooxygenase SsuD/methylene tetrahydromethanopterin reductase-like flavin-dependent oxidoreductase (luciferase family)
VRDTVAAARAAWADTARRHGIEERVTSDGSDRGLTVGGPPADVADYLAGYRDAGVGESIFTFRAPFDLETISRLGEMREALDAVLRS